MPHLQNEYIRNQEDIEMVLHHANISKDTLQKPFQVLYFADCLKPALLLELNQPVAESLSSGSTLRFIGKSKDKLILCTKEETFDVKSAQTSNSFLIVPNLRLPNEIEKNGSLIIRTNITCVHHSYLEIKRMKPDVGRIRLLLDKSAYQGPELEPEIYLYENGYYTTDDLLEEIQTSEGELNQALNDADALQIKGYWRRLSFEYNFRVLSYLINLIDENSWSLSSIPMGEAVTTLKELLPHYIAEHIFSIYCIATGAMEDDDQLFELDTTKVCRCLAAALLSHADKFNLDDFMVAWHQGVPEGIDVKLDMIKDMIIIEGSSDTSTSIRYFPEYNLSGNINERFKQLFKAKSLWNYEDIEPFLKKLSSEKQDVKSILTKYTRTFRKDNTIYYSSKYGK